MKHFYLFFVLASFNTFAQIKSPQEYLKHYGQQVQFYHEVEAYFKHLSEKSPLIKEVNYGQTYQGRNLNTYFITSEENHQNLEQIRQNHLHQIGLYPKSNGVSDKAIIWVTFNVHGNEIGAIQSAIQVAYELANTDNIDTKKWLDDVVIILDPCANPDGYARYSNWLIDISGKKLHPELYDREHMEPWPGGRQNHYVYDLNRDWAWQVQLESQLRMNLYHEWMPMVHMDIHEMGYNEPYFFPPAAEPFHDLISDYQIKFHNQIGEHTSKKFDDYKWMYYSGERFDLFYPSYGDTYPSFNGAIGMTYEQGGIGAGRAIKMKNGKILTIQDRIDHHKVAVLAGIEWAYIDRNQLISEFKKYFKDQRTPKKNENQTYILKHHARNHELIKLLNRNRIESHFADEIRSLKGYHYQTNREESFIIEPNDLIISTHQPRAALTKVLLEPHHHLSDSLSYDITSWALPWAYGIDAYAVKSDVKIKTKAKIDVQDSRSDKNVYAYYFPWDDRNSIRVLGQLHQHDIKVRKVLKPSEINGIKLKRGGLIVQLFENSQITDFESKMEKIIKQKQGVQILNSGFSSQGNNLGGEGFTLLEKPKVMVLAGNGISNIDFGQVWYFMEQVAEFPLSVVELSNFNRINFKNYNTLILPQGNYQFTENQQKTIDDFVSSGGKVIAMQDAVRLFDDKKGYALKAFAKEEDKTNEEKKNEESNLEQRFYDYEGNERRSVSYQISGAIVENKVDITHPLSYGIGNIYFSLKTSENCYQLLKNAQNVVYVPKKYQSSGFIGSKLKNKIEETVTFAVDYKGRGHVIYMIDNPLFRGFWENGNLLFANALFMVD